MASTKAQKKKAAFARQAKAQKKAAEDERKHLEAIKKGVCLWDGSVNVEPEDIPVLIDMQDSDDSDSSDIDVDPADDPFDGDDEECSELLPHEHLAARQADLHEGPVVIQVNAALIKNASEMKNRDWKKAEMFRGAYTGNSKSWAREKRRNMERREASDAETRKGAEAAFMAHFVDIAPRTRTPIPIPRASTPPFNGYESDIPDERITQSNDILHHLDLTLSDDEEVNEIEVVDDGVPEIRLRKIPAPSVEPGAPQVVEEVISSFKPPRPLPPPKRQRHAIPVRHQRLMKKEACRKELEKARDSITSHIRSKRTVWEGPGLHSIQARRARAVESHLNLVLKGETHTDASETAAKAHGWSKNHGAQNVRRWVRIWIESRTLPSSNRGAHAKTWSFLSDPNCRTKMTAFCRSNKWSMNPAKLKKWINQTMLPEEAAEYGKQIVDREMPAGLKTYINTELLPRIGVKKPVSIHTCRRIMLEMGFKYTEHKKALYYDGHERPDVVEDQQDHYVPAMLKEHYPRAVRYVVGDVEKEAEGSLNWRDYPAGTFVRPRLVVCAHDEMTAQANDGLKKTWVLEGEQPLRKKGVGRGIHQSDVICSTVGWLAEASETLEYGKNHKGYWNGELFIKQLKEKIIPAFERAHGAGHQALFMIDNSQGHLAYATDALLVSRMNLKPGGKQAIMRDGWYIDNEGCRISQSMVYGPGKGKLSNQPKGMKAVLEERGLWSPHLKMRCATGDNRGGWPSLHSAPQVHCELNFIEFFWGAVKRYLRENCDYTFETLKLNMPKALAHIGINTIRKWEMRTIRWCKAYRSGLDAKDAQKKVFFKEVYISSSHSGSGS
ncbi:hypothetical protein CYLTODRAFT_447875 [Cylindrobasidium torrendii FP15055 ss-10]|uniref:DDE-1 domain-containing protein n=1 Tax=Cylindrobasidium torrendii FP15055 ss-10 TaxID=1314674 RepID=A0A0D7AUJ2_9AGAR|nr:hypothetical protein CYLTODRAFT_447875 [Cylindrobasidium torrendii FP15055 ss-10]